MLLQAVVPEAHYGRIIAVCCADEININSALVAEGLAWAYVRYSEDTEQEGASPARV